MSSSNGNSAAPMPFVRQAPMPTMSPAETVKMIGARTIDLTNFYLPPKRTTTGTLAPAVASNVVEGPASIVELARALKNDPDLIFEWVYNNIDYHPVFGEAKGALGCLIDNCGGAFDQCELLVALLTQAGFSPHYVLGQIQITAAQAAAWLGTDPSNLSYAFALLNNGGIPVQYANNNTELLLSHIWVGGVVIGGTSYVFDPSFKQYNTIAGVNLAAATGYSQATLLAQAETGATIDPSGNYVQNLNRTDLRNQLTTYATNLMSWIKTNMPGATVDQIVGGRTINQISAPVRLTSLPYEAPGDVPTTFTTVPNQYRITVSFQFQPVGAGTSFTQNFFGSDVHGQRLSLFGSFFGTPWTFTLNGTTLQTSNAGSANVTISVTHPYSSTFANQSGTQGVTGASFNTYIETFQYVFGCSFGPIGQGLIDIYNEQSLSAIAAGNTQLSEAVLGNEMALLYFTRWAQISRSWAMLGNLTETTVIQHHDICTQSNQNGPNGGYVIAVNDLLPLLSPSALNASANTVACGSATGLIGSATEDLSIQQVVGQAAVSTPLVLDTANASSTALYKITPANQSTLLPLLSGYSSGATAEYTAQLAAGSTLLIPQTFPQTKTGKFQGGGWGALFQSSIGGIIYGINLTYGGTATNFQSLNWQNKPVLKDPCDCEEHDPVDDRTGDYRYESSDITVGSQGFPYQLEFKSMYDSRLSGRNIAGMGLGWTNNLQMNATITTEPMRPLGSQSPIEAAASIVFFYAAADLFSDTTYPVTKLAVEFLMADWWVDQMPNGNAVTISLPEGDYTYVLLADGTYGPQLNDNGTVVVDISGGSITLTTPQKDVRYFSASQNFANTIYQWVFPNGTKLRYTSNGSMVTGVSNNTGRSLTLNYTGNVLSSVTDGNGRSSQYSVNTTTNLLSSITDPNGFATTFSYDSSNRFVSYFRPQNPTTAYVTNSYDSLNRVSQQLDQYGNKRTFYFADSRSEFVDPAGNSRVQYYDAYDNLIEDIDELGNITTYARDGRGRVSLLTYPEGNSEAYTYDSLNNVLAVTYQAKAGSGLANIVNSYTYDPTYNKVHTAVDGKSQTTTYNYDPATGNLLTVVKPAVGGVSPKITYAYNSVGQVWSSIDETGIQTQNNYDTTTEELLSTVVNTNWRATIGGTVTVGDALTLTAHDTLLSGGQESVNYTVKTGDTTATIAAGLAAAVNADANLAAIGIVAYVNGTVASLSTATGNNTTFTKSTNTGATETVTLAAGLKLTTTYGYDAVGNVNSVKDPRSNTTTFLFDNARRLTQRTETTPFSYVTMYGYDKNNNLTSVQRQTGITQTPWQTYIIAYTVSDKVYTVTDPAMHVTTKTYDTFDRLWTVTDAQSRKTTFAYDARSKLHTVTDPSNTISETRTYTNNGKLYQLTDARSNTTTYSYDGFDRLNKTTYADTSYEQNSSYDANNNVLTQRTRSAATITLTYDPLNRLSTKLPTGQAKVTFSYDLSGRLTQAATPVVSGNPATGAFKFSYDTAGRLTQETTPDALTVKYGLDANGNVTKLTYPDSYYVTRVYDQLNRLTDIKLNGATASAIHITYDELSRRNVLTYGNGATSTYTFQLNDDLTGLAESFTGSSVVFTYGFNNVHQETSRSVSDGTYLWHPGAGGATTYGIANSINEYPTVGGASYSYDGNGNLKSDGTWTYTFDTENHLLSASKTGVTASYVYDGLHRQVQKTVGTSETRFYYAGWQRLADYDGVAKTLQNRYVYGTELDEALLQVDSSGSLTYLHADRLGSIIATSNSTGGVVGTADYGPFGENAPPSGSSVGYSGQRYDNETGLYYYKNRYYAPLLGRFLQTDPDLSNFPNLYTYVNNDPLNQTDPLGMIATVALVEFLLLAYLFALYLLWLQEQLKKCNCGIPSIRDIDWTPPEIGIPGFPGVVFAKKSSAGSNAGGGTSGSSGGNRKSRGNRNFTDPGDVDRLMRIILQRLPWIALNPNYYRDLRLQVEYVLNRYGIDYALTWARNYEAE